MNKVELQAKVDSLTDEINFLRAFYDAVSISTPLDLPCGALQRVQDLGVGPSVNVTGRDDLTISCSAGTGSDANPHLRHFCGPLHGQQP